LKEAPASLTIFKQEIESGSDMVPKKVPQYYTVRQGDNLSKIASKYKTTVNQIMSLNKLKSTTLRVGQSLNVGTKTIMVPAPASVSKSEPVNKDTVSITQPVSNTSQTPKNTSKPTTTSSYKVKQGDTLYQIAKKFNVTVLEIKTWNQLKSDRINIGQVLVIRKKP
jgi:LysM repeat protein